MNSEIIRNLLKYKIIEDPFDFIDLEKELADKYEYFENRFQELYRKKSEQFELKDCHFYIKSDYSWNAFASRVRGYNIMGITHGYAKQLMDMFDDKYFSSMIYVALGNEVSISEAYCDLYDRTDFKFSKFMLDCSIQFTFGHEFQHILQFNSLKVATDYKYNENLDYSKFDMKKHAWEYDADRFGAFEVLKYIYEIKQKLEIKNNCVFKCMLYLGLGSMFINKLLFYYGIVNFKDTIRKQEFYTKKHSHPHPLVRLFNMMDYFFDCSETSFPNLGLDKQELLNNILSITKVYLYSVLPNSTVMIELFKDLDNHLDDINRYNNELHDFAIHDNSIKELLIARGINFEGKENIV